jgi:GGDEF domain-containing protein
LNLQSFPQDLEMDALTGVYNRRHFLELTEAEIIRVRHYRRISKGQGTFASSQTLIEFFVFV